MKIKNSKQYGNSCYWLAQLDDDLRRLIAGKQSGVISEEMYKMIANGLKLIKKKVYKAMEAYQKKQRRSAGIVQR